MTTRKEINPIVLKFGVALAVSFAGYLFSRLRPKCRAPSLPPPPSSSSSDVNRQISSSSEMEDDHHEAPTIPSHRGMNSNSGSQVRPLLRVMVGDNGSSESSPSTSHNGGRDRVLSPPRIRHVEREEYEQEVMSLCRTMNELQEREQLLQKQLLKYQALEKDHERSLMELQSRLKIKNLEHKIFTLKMESLGAQSRRLEAQVVGYPTVVAELDAAKAKIRELMRKLKCEVEYNREQIMKLKERVSLLKQKEQGSSEISQDDMLRKLQRLQDLEGERDELRKCRDELKRENSELDKRLESTQNLMTKMLGDPQVGGVQHEAARLMAENERLTMEVERLQLNRCADTGELVYLRWINACLRFELRNYQPPPGKTIARDLSKCLSPRSEAKAKQLILEYAYSAEERGVSIVDFEYDQWSSTLSNPTDPGDQDDQWVDATSSNNAHHTKGLKLFDRLRRLLKGKDKIKHSKAKNLVMSRSVEDLRKTYPCESSTRAPSLSPRGKEIMGMKRSRSASSSQVYKRLVLGRESGGSVSPLESQPEETPELSFRKTSTDLVRYAEVLKESPWSRRKHRKSASVL